MKPELLRALPKMDLLLARPALAGSPCPTPCGGRRPARCWTSTAPPCVPGRCLPSPAWMSWSSPSSAGARSWPGPHWGG
ncbi:hypothetical protein M5E87_10075 [Flavonifractor plautii]|nr:hypothetical protein M5E87_10075 [Flavonifractor plautii]